jgi:hypothetical protein
MDQAEGIVRARAALDTVEQLLRTSAALETDSAGRAELRYNLGELCRLLAQLEGGEAPPGRGEGADEAREADAG